jgi:hypothetical protein
MHHRLHSPIARRPVSILDVDPNDSSAYCGADQVRPHRCVCGNFWRLSIVHRSVRQESRYALMSGGLTPAAHSSEFALTDNPNPQAQTPSGRYTAPAAFGPFPVRARGAHRDI